jgi:hypothetical protein
MALQSAAKESCRRPRGPDSRRERARIPKQRDLPGPLPRFDLVKSKWPIRGDACHRRQRMPPPAMA